MQPRRRSIARGAWLLAAACSGEPTPPARAPDSTPTTRDPQTRAEVARTDVGGGHPAAARPAAGSGVGESAERETRPEFRFLALIGDPPPLQATTPGRYASRVQTTRTTYRTTEHYHSESHRGAAELEIRDDGTFVACVAADVHERSSVSKYATPDGKPTSEESSARKVAGLEGHVAYEGDALVLTVESMRYVSCDGAAQPLSVPPRVWCVTLAASAVLPSPALACRAVPGADALEIPVGVPAGLDPDDPRLVGSDRDDPTATGILLLGADPGLAVRWQDRRGRQTLELERAEVTVDRE